MDFTQIIDMIRQNGDAAYGLMFGYAATNSLLFPLFAGYAAQAGAFDWGKLILVCWAGAAGGDVLRFWIARRYGVRWLARFPRLARHVERTARLVDHHGLWLPFVHRFPNGIRSVAGFAFGVSALPWRTFMILNVVSAGIWSAGLVSAGYALAHVAAKTVSDVASAASLALLIAFAGLFWLLGRRLDAALARR